MTEVWPAELFEMADLVTPMAIRVAATLRLADHIEEGATTVTALAERTGTDADALGRTIDHLVSVGVFESDEADRYGLGPLGRRLRSADPAHGRGWLDISGPVGRADLALLRLLDTVRTGEAGYPMVFGSTYWDDLAADPALSASFDALMASQRQRDALTLIEAYDWSGVRRVVDVGGGNATLLAAILRANPHLHGTVVDLAGPAAAAEANLAAQGLHERGTVVTGSFFEPLPGGADVYILSVVLHDWTDHDAIAILRRCAAAAGPDGTVLVLERLMDQHNARSETTTMDLRMLAYFAGRERTLSDFDRLAAAVGLTRGQLHHGEHRSLIALNAAAPAADQPPA